MSDEPAHAAPTGEPTAPLRLGPVPTGFAKTAVTCAFVSVFLGVASFFGLAIGFFAEGDGMRSDVAERVRIVSVLGLFATVIAIAGLLVTWIVWVHRAWSWLPPEYRRSRLHEGVITPRQAVGRLVIPIYGLFWFLVVEEGLLDAIAAMQSRVLPEGVAPASVPKTYMLTAFAAIMVAPMPPIFATAYAVHQRNVRRAMEQLARFSRPA